VLSKVDNLMNAHQLRNAEYFDYSNANNQSESMQGGGLQRGDSVNVSRQATVSSKSPQSLSSRHGESIGPRLATLSVPPQSPKVWSRSGLVSENSQSPQRQATAPVKSQLQQDIEEREIMQNQLDELKNFAAAQSLKLGSLGSS
jgi:hypothetical protein